MVMTGRWGRGEGTVAVIEKWGGGTVAVIGKVGWQCLRYEEGDVDDVCDRKKGMVTMMIGRRGG